MKKTLACCISLGWILNVAQAQTPPCPLDQAPNVVSVILNQEGVGSLYGINQAYGEMGENPTWCYTDDAGVLRILPFEPFPSLMNLMSMQVDTSGHWLAVYSEGEGHPMIDIYSLADVLWAFNDQENPAEAVITLNPYPGYVDIKGWNGNVLEFESDMPFDQLDSLEAGFPPEVNPGEIFITFQLEPASGKTTRILTRE